LDKSMSKYAYKILKMQFIDEHIIKSYIKSHKTKMNVNKIFIIFLFATD